MKCHICDASIENPKWNTDHKGYDPCTICLEVIDNCFEDYIEEEDEKESNELCQGVDNQN